MKLIPKSERDPKARCWFCRTDKRVIYTAKIVHMNPLSKDRYMNIYVCTKCAKNHKIDFIEEVIK